MQDKRRREARSVSLDLDFDPNEFVLEKLRFWVAHRGLTPIELQDRSGVERSTIVRLLDGKNRPMIDTLYALAKGLSVPISEFILNSDSTTARLDAQARPAAVLVQEMAELPVDKQSEVLTLMRNWVKATKQELKVEKRANVA